MVGELDGELANPSPDNKKVLQLRRSPEEKVELLKKMNAEILYYIEEDALADEVAQSDNLAGTVS